MLQRVNISIACMGVTPAEERDVEAKALSAIYARKAGDVDKKDFGKLHEIGSGSMMWQYLSGHRPLNLAAATRFAKALDVPIDSFSPRLAKEAVDGYQATTLAMTAAAPGGQAMAGSSAITARENITDWWWPFKQIDQQAVRALSAADLLRLEGAILGVAGALSLDLAVRRPPT